MIPKVHKTGHSFAGVATYLLHDKDRATTDERVEWTETRNLATDDPHVAWRVMAATSMDNEKLKKAAGRRATGPKSKAHVLHYTLSWHLEEGEKLTREEIVRAADASLAVLGRQPTDDREGQTASEHQAFFVCHNDEPHPHVHIVVNRVHPEHGIALSSSHDWNKLSDWAEGYERDRGKIYCEQRVKNNEARRRGEYVKGEPDKPRHIYELEQKYKDHPDRDRIIAEQKAKDRALRERQRATQKRQRAEWQTLREGYKAKRERLKQQGERAIAKAEANARADLTPRWRQLYRKHQQELTQFGEREKRFMGRIRNALNAVDWRAMLRSETRGAAIRGVFKALASKGVRAEALEKSHLRETRKLEQNERGAIGRGVAAARKDTKQKLSKQRQQYLKSREQLAERHQRETDEISRAWTERRTDRQNAWMEKVAQRDFNAASQGAKSREGRTGRRGEDRRLERDERRRRKRQPRGRDRGPDDGRTR